MLFLPANPVSGVFIGKLGNYLLTTNLYTEIDNLGLITYIFIHLNDRIRYFQNRNIVRYQIYELFG